MTTSRGIRNNNPGNIELSGINWQGMAKQQSDGRFIQFTEMKYGCRALLKLLNTYVTKHNLNTIHDIINRYAPNNENNTSAYVNAVASELGVEPKQQLDFDDNMFLNLVKAIANHENGKEQAKVITEYDWEQALNSIK